jgi:Metallo-beta-lactamase superfamily
MIFTLEALPAKEGDCLLLHWGTAADKKLAVIDGGPGRIYDDELRPRLEEIAANLDVTPLPLEIVLVSHVDNDHIVGIRKLLADVRHEVDQQLPLQNRTLKIERLWHNTFNDILGDSITKHYEDLPIAAVQASASGDPDPAIVTKLSDSFRQRQGDSEKEAREHAQEIALILASQNEGRKVRIDHTFLFNAHQIAALNSPFKNAAGQPTLITAEMTPDPKEIAGLKFTIVAPLQQQIEDLQEDFDKFITDNQLTAEAVLAAYADDSVTNLSSIVCLVESGGKTILLTGDARGDHILTGLQNAGLLDASDKIEVDVLKVPHHGSEHNVEPAFFERVLADTYVFSGDGKHGNPDRSTLEWLVAARGDEPIHIILTYDVDSTDQKRKHDYQIKNKAWNQAHDSLKAFFANLAQSHPQIKVDLGAPIIVDLGDEKVTW